MATFRNGLRAGGALALLAGAAALAQERPESILPPGFSQSPAPAPTASRSPQAPAATPGATPRPSLVLPDLEPGAPGALPTPEPSPTISPSPTPTVDAAELRNAELPAYARRSLATVGLIGPDEGGIAPYGFGRSDGRFLESLMRGARTPIASRWLEIVLRRALMSRVDTPPHVNGADFAAERAWLLLRLGEANAARSVVNSVDLENYTPKLVQVAQQAALATGDPEGLCPILPLGMKTDATRGWILTQAICAGLAGQAGVAGPLIDGARKHNVASGVDLLLAEKVVGAGAKGRRAVTIEWTGVDTLTAWRYGLAAATGVAIPDELFDTVDPQARAFFATAPMYPARARAAAAEQAAASGVLSNLALVDLYGAIDADDDSSGTPEAATARDLGTAYTGTRDDRIDAMKRLWSASDDAQARYARLVLTARAAARIAPDASLDADVRDRLVASMLTAGLTTPALRWREAVSHGSDAWAMLTLADIAGPRLGSGDAGALGGAKGALFAAGLAGLGRIDRPSSLAGENSWTRAIDHAAAMREGGTVALLAATGMGTPDWRGVSPLALYHVCRALVLVGRAPEAAMIAAEAIART